MGIRTSTNVHLRNASNIIPRGKKTVGGGMFIGIETDGEDGLTEFDITFFGTERQLEELVAAMGAALERAKNS